MFNISKLDGISAVEDLTDAAAAVVEGGGIVEGTLFFDSFQATRPIAVPRGGNVQFGYISKSADSSGFTVVLKNINTGRATAPRQVGTGAGSSAGGTVWRNVRGGNYRFDLSDRKDGSFIGGTYRLFSD